MQMYSFNCKYLFNEFLLYFHGVRHSMTVVKDLSPLLFRTLLFRLCFLDCFKLHLAETCQRSCQFRYDFDFEKLLKIGKPFIVTEKKRIWLALNVFPCWNILVLEVFQTIAVWISTFWHFKNKHALKQDR
jgi:hypothetical protein